MGRTGRHALNMAIAHLMSERSTCSRGRIGCVITLDGRIISTGYNGAPSGLEHCQDRGGCITGADGGCATTVHAEAGAIAFAARKGLSVEGSTMYVTMSPCVNCAKLIINSGIKEVIIDELYRDQTGLNLLNKADIDIYFVENLLGKEDTDWLRRKRT